MLPLRPSLQQLQKQAKELLKDIPQLENLAAAQFTIARQYGFESWAKLKHHLEANQPPEQHEQLARDLSAAYTKGDAMAIRQINWNYGTSFPWDHDPLKMPPRSLKDARRMVARACEPPFYTIDWNESSLSVRGPQPLRLWDTIIAVMKEHRLTKLHAGGMIDAAMPLLPQLNHLTCLNISNSKALTDEGMKHLSRMPQLLDLELGGWSSPLTDAGLEALRPLTQLKRVAMCWTQGVSDSGIANLAGCEHLEDVNLLGTAAGDGSIQAFSGKQYLRQFRTGKGVTDVGLDLLQYFPVFRNWQGGEVRYSLMSATADPNHLLIDGSFTNAGIRRLVLLEGLFGLTFFWHCPAFTSEGLASLRQLPHLGFLGCQDQHCDDEAMRHIASIPHLRMLMGQGAVASDAGFEVLSRSQTIEYFWGRDCPNFSSRGFAALASMPTLRGIAVSCKNVDAAALSALPHFPALRDLMPMDVSDDGFRHIGQCENLEGLWCMYCRETGDLATGHLAGLKHLKTYYAGKTKITDLSLEILGRMASLEKLEFWQCEGLTNTGIAQLASLPQLREISLDGLPGVTAEAVKLFPNNVRVQYAS